MSITTVQQELSTAEGFAGKTAHKRGAVSLAWGLLMLGAIGLVWNLISTYMTVSNTSMRFFGAVFFSARTTRADFDPVAFVYIWGPFIAIPLGLILLAYAGATSGKAKQALFERYQARGFVARQEELGLPLKIARENNTESLVALSSPELGEERFDQEVAALRAGIPTISAKELKPLIKKLSTPELRATGIEANTVWPVAPEGLVLTTKRPTEHLVVVRPDPAKPGAKRELLAIKA